MSATLPSRSCRRSPIVRIRGRRYTVSAAQSFGNRFFTFFDAIGGPFVSTLSQSFLGSYRLLAPIRTGRYTQVWAAIDDVEQRYVAAKLLLPEYRHDREQLQTMRHELEVGRKLSHPGCLGAFELRTAPQGGAYLLMDLFAGENLRDLIKRRYTVIRKHFASIVRQGAESIAHLNSIGYVHLDVKPDNFMLNEAGELKLIDFALAKGPPNAWERFFWKQRQTKIQGTRSYLSPEQIRRDPIDARSDVYSFGCTLYQMAARVPPFTAPNSDELLKKHLYSAPPNLAIACPDATPEFITLVRRMLSKRREERPHSLGELLPDLMRMEFWREESADKPAPTAQQRQNAG